VVIKTFTILIINDPNETIQDIIPNKLFLYRNLLIVDILNMWLIIPTLKYKYLQPEIFTVHVFFSCWLEAGFQEFDRVSTVRNSARFKYKLMGVMVYF
jgi:hypothetical protein